MPRFTVGTWKGREWERTTLLSWNYPAGAAQGSGVESNPGLTQPFSAPDPLSLWRQNPFLLRLHSSPRPPSIKPGVRTCETFPHWTGSRSGYSASGSASAAGRRRPGRPGSGGAAPAAARQALGGQVQVAAQEGGGGGAARPRPHLLSPAP